MRDMKFMRDLIGTSALALIFSIGVAGAQPSQPDEARKSPAKQQTSPQTDKPQTQGKDESTPTRDTTIAPSEDEIVGPPEAEAGQRNSENLAGSPTNDATGGHRDMAEIPGATPQTMPAKYSQENSDRLEYSIMGYPVQLTDEQKQTIWDSIGNRSSTASTLGVTVHAEAGVFLPPSIEAQALPGNLNEEIPAVRGLKYVKVDGKVLLVQPANGIVRGVVEE